MLHLNGYCYRDISSGNMVDPDTGDVLICDNDNVGINRQSDSQVDGTYEFMAPEVIIALRGRRRRRIGTRLPYCFSSFGCGTIPCTVTMSLSGVFWTCQ